MARRKPGQPPKKVGRPGKVTPQHETEILAILTVGASRQDCADYIGVHYKTLYKYWHAHPDFAVRMKQAEVKGKVYHLNKIGKAPQWQASAFMLERKWPQDFGRRDYQDVNVRADVTNRHDVTSDVKKILTDRETLDLANSLARRMARHPGGAGEPTN